MSDVRLSDGVVTLLLPPRGSSEGQHGQAYDALMSQALGVEAGAARLTGWHARFCLQRHGLQVLGDGGGLPWFANVCACSIGGGFMQIERQVRAFAPFRGDAAATGVAETAQKSL